MYVIFYTLFVSVEITASEFVHHTSWFCIKYCTLEITGNIQSLVGIPERNRILSRPRSIWEERLKWIKVWDIKVSAEPSRNQYHTQRKKNSTRRDITTQRHTGPNETVREPVSLTLD